MNVVPSVYLPQQNKHCLRHELTVRFRLDLVNDFGDIAISNFNVLIENCLFTPTFRTCLGIFRPRDVISRRNPEKAFPCANTRHLIHKVGYDILHWQPNSIKSDHPRRSYDVIAVSWWWRPRRRKSTSGSGFGDVAHLGRWKTICLPNFDKIPQVMAEILLIQVSENKEPPNFVRIGPATTDLWRYVDFRRCRHGVENLHCEPKTRWQHICDHYSGKTRSIFIIFAQL